jgi:hypothetical protein
MKTAVAFGAAATVGKIFATCWNEMGRFGTSWENSRVKSMLRQGLVHRSKKARATPSGCSFVLDCANDRREYGPSSTSGDHLWDDAFDAQIAGLCCCRDRRQQQGNDLAELPGAPRMILSGLVL